MKIIRSTKTTKIIFTVLMTTMLSATAMACPKGTTLTGGTGPNHKGGKCVAINKDAKAPAAKTTDPKATVTPAAAAKLASPQPADKPAPAATTVKPTPPKTAP